MTVIEPHATVRWSVFAPEVVFAATDVPFDLACHAVRASAIDLCVRAQCLVRTLRLDLQAGVSEYVLRVGDEERIESVQRGCVNSRFRTGVVELSNTAARLPCSGVAGQAARFEHPDRIHLEAEPQRDVHGALFVRVAVVPQRDAVQCDRLLYERYHEPIVDGALARLLRQRLVPWSDPLEAEARRQRASAGVSAAGIDRITGGMRGPFAMRARRVL